MISRAKAHGRHKGPIASSLVNERSRVSAGVQRGVVHGASRARFRRCTAGCAVTLEGDRTVSAAFEGAIGDRLAHGPPDRLGDRARGPSPDGIACKDACSATFAAGAVVTLSQTTAAGSRFARVERGLQRRRGVRGDARRQRRGPGAGVGVPPLAW